MEHKEHKSVIWPGKDSETHGELTSNNIGFKWDFFFYETHGLNNQIWDLILKWGEL